MCRLRYQVLTEGEAGGVEENLLSSFARSSAAAALLGVVVCVGSRILHEVMLSPTPRGYSRGR